MLHTARECFSAIAPVIIIVSVGTCLVVTSNAVGKWAGVAGVAGPIIWWVVIVVLGLLWPEYSAVTTTISELAAVGAPDAIIQQRNF